MFVKSKASIVMLNSNDNIDKVPCLQQNKLISWIAKMMLLTGVRKNLEMRIMQVGSVSLWKDRLG